MAKKILNDLSLGDKVSFKDSSYGSGYVLGYNKEIGKHLIGYNATSKRHSGAFTNTGGNFVQNKENKYVYSDKLKGYQYFFYADSTLELLNTEENTDHKVGDEVEVQFQANGSVCSKNATWDGTATRKATIVGFNDVGEPVLYFNIPPAGTVEYGLAYSPDFDRWLDKSYDGKLDVKRLAFLQSGSVSMSKISNKVRKEKVKVMSGIKESGEKLSFMDMMKANAGEAAYRVASKQLSVATKAAILKVMENKGQSSDRIAALKEMLDTAYGEALVSFLIGIGLTYLPMVSNDPRAAKLAEEFRVGSMTTVGNEVIGVAVEHFLPVIQSALTALPEAATEKKQRVLDAPAEEQEETKTEAKTLTA